MNLQGRVAAITGGAGHVGRVIAETLSELGASVVIIDQQEVAARHVATNLSAATGSKSISLCLDLSDEQAVRSIPDAIKDQCGRLDILIHCAALVGTSSLKGWAVPFAEQQSDTWRQALEVNLTAVFVLTQACQRLLEDSGKGSIITINSIYGIVGPSMALYEGTSLGNPAAYAASKGGLLQLTRWFSTALAPKVRSNSITLGGLYRDHQDPFLTRYIERVPLHRMGTEEDMKGAVAYLASDASAYVTGQNIIIDGGWTAW